MTRGRRYTLFGITVVIALACAGLGLWQANRLLTRRAANRVAIAGRELPPVDLGGAIEPLAQRRVRATGTWDHAHTILLRNRLERDAPGVQVVVPLRLAGRDEVVLVDRGFAPASDAILPDTATLDRADSGTVEGIAFPVPDAGDGLPLTRRGATSWQRLDRTALRDSLPYPVLDVYVHVTGREPRTEPGRPWPVPAALPPLDDGPHLAYMVQWFLIGGAALGFGVVFVLRGGRVDDPAGNSGQIV